MKKTFANHRIEGDRGAGVDPNIAAAASTETPTTTRVGTVQIERADATGCYQNWPPPTTIVSDGAYGLGLFPGDPPTPKGLTEWYEPHVAAWSRFALPETTLWFWCNEIGWATVHPLLMSYGWQYRAFHVWDKGIGHIAGNVNSRTIRRFPVVTEVCVQYTREVTLLTADQRRLPLQSWLRAEWLRSGLPLSRTNEACGVKDAATRKYFTRDYRWYFPPGSMIEKLAEYAARHGNVTTWPYFSLDGKSAITAGQWERLRAKWRYIHGVTNVWSEPPVRGSERIKHAGLTVVHANQKPLVLLERLILATSDPGDVVWEPFGGLCTTAVAAFGAGRACYSAEIVPEYYQRARTRLQEVAAEKLIVPMPEVSVEEIDDSVGNAAE